MKRLLCGFAACGLLVSLSGPAKAQYSYTMFDKPGADWTEGHGINNSGQIVGYYYDDSVGWHGFLRDVDALASDLLNAGVGHGNLTNIEKGR